MSNLNWIGTQQSNRVDVLSTIWSDDEDLGATIPFDEGVKLLVKQDDSFTIIEAMRRAAVFIFKKIGWLCERIGCLLSRNYRFLD